MLGLAIDDVDPYIPPSMHNYSSARNCTRSDPPPLEQRSALMARVRSRDTKPEMIVRRIAHGLGYRFRLAYRGLPGTPDLVFPRHKKVILVHGCFWHRHDGCARTTTPKTRRSFWQAKFDRNVERDRQVIAALWGRGWDVLVIWECETKKTDELRTTIRYFMGNCDKRLR